MQNGLRLLAVTLCAVVAMAAPTPLSSSGKVLAAGGGGAVDGEYELLLRGLFEPIENGPDLGLELVDLNEGTWGQIKIFRVGGKQALGTFYERYDEPLCAYQLPGGNFVAVIDEQNDHHIVIGGELFQYATVELSIPEATGIYQDLVGGSIHMNFVRHIIDNVSLHEYCHCYISPPTRPTNSSALWHNAR